MGGVPVTQTLRPPDLRVHVPLHPGAAPRLVMAADVAAKLLLLASLVLVVVDPSWGNLEGKAPLARALIYPMWALVVPVLWVVRRRPGPFPWVADLLLTAMCFSDILGNRLDLYDSVSWFDDWMHVMNSALVSAAVLVLTPRPGERRQDLVSRAVAYGLTASLAWELWEYQAFLTRSGEVVNAYADTLGDLGAGWLGAVAAAMAVGLWRDRA
jgi:hypothetical protein